MKKIFLSPLFMPIAVLVSMAIGGVCTVIQTVQQTKVAKKNVQVLEDQHKMLTENKSEE